MTDPIMLDATPLGKLAHPRRNPDIAAWYAGLVAARVTIIVPEIADYEVRRNLLLHGLHQSLSHLDWLKSLLTYQALNTSVMLKAAELWADARQRGQPTSDPKELDCDVILAAQALDAGATIVTENVEHLSRFASALDWRDMK